MQSLLSHLECTYCGESYSAEVPQRSCRKCGRVLYARYDLDAARSLPMREALGGRAADMWRYFEMMPVRDERNVVSLGEGFTPMLRADRLGERLGAEDVRIKDEALNPTASFKARGLSVAVSKAKELGIEALAIPSAGNAAGAMVAYAAKAGMESHVFMPQDSPAANIKEVKLAGAHLAMVDGLINDAGKLSRQRAAELDLFDVSTLQEPYRAEGKKTLGYEIAEQMEWSLPEVIVYPTGGGTGVVGIWKAIEEMEALGWLSGPRPRMYCVQAEGCAPIVKAFHEGKEFAEPWQDAQTVAAGIRVPVAFGDYLILRALRESGGGALTVSDAEILFYMREVATLEGLVICPEGAATVAALRKLLADGIVSPAETVLLLNTGSGLKYLDLL